MDEPNQTTARNDQTVAGGGVMKVKPMIFNADMVRALREGRKTQTRIPFSKSNKKWLSLAAEAMEIDEFLESGHPCKRDESHVLDFAPVRVGDLIYVRETMIAQEVGGYDLACYAVDGSPVLVHSHKCNDFNGSWDHWNYHSYTRPSIHMPRRASRLTLKVTGVRVERVQDISEQDAIKEGFECWDDDVTGGRTPFGDFSEVWCGIYGEESWNRNDSVCVIEFEVIHQNVDEYLDGVDL